jgi:nucleoside 2-deoxyribosyltransferase
MASKKKAAAGSKPLKKVKWPFPRATLEKALQVPLAIKEHNGGNPWDTEEVRKAVGASAGNAWFYLTAASRDYGLTSGTRDTPKISLEELGRDIVYAPNPEAELTAKKQAFLKIDIFKRVLEYYKGSNLPDMKYLGNTLTKEFELEPETHAEFARIFRENCQYLGIESGVPTVTAENGGDGETVASAPDTVTLSEGSSDSSLTAFVILPFVERDPKHPKGFFAEVLRSIITPAAKDFKVKTANRQGSDVIQSTIISDLIEADLVVADLTEHNPNVMFELGVRMAHDKPVVLMKAEGTGPLFDVDNMLRVFEYSPNLWATTVEKDMPNLRDFMKGAWENRDSTKTYMKILRGRGKT